MINKYHYWTFKEVLSKKACEDIINFSKEKRKKIGLTGGLKEKELSKKDIKKLKQKRNSDIVWLNESWIYNQILPYVRIANKNAGWNYQLDNSEKTQFTIY